MAKKLLFKKGKSSYGNIKCDIICVYKKIEINLGCITKFKQGEYWLPVWMFPRRKNLLPQKTKTLFKAMHRLQLWWNNFIKEQSEKP